MDIFGDIDLPDNMSRDDLVAQVDVDKDLQTSGTYMDEELVDEAKRRRQQTENLPRRTISVMMLLPCGTLRDNYLSRNLATPNKPKLIHFLIIHSHTCKYS